MSAPRGLTPLLVFIIVIVGSLRQYSQEKPSMPYPRMIFLMSLAMIAFAGSRGCAGPRSSTPAFMQPVSPRYVSLRRDDAEPDRAYGPRQTGRQGKRSFGICVVCLRGVSFLCLCQPFCRNGRATVFGAVQTTMSGHGIAAGERMLKLRLGGLAIALVMPDKRHAGNIRQSQVVEQCLRRQQLVKLT